MKERGRRRGEREGGQQGGQREVIGPGGDELSGGK